MISSKISNQSKIISEINEDQWRLTSDLSLWHLKVKSFFKECIRSRQRPIQLQRVCQYWTYIPNRHTSLPIKLVGFIWIFRILQLINRKFKQTQLYWHKIFINTDRKPAWSEMTRLSLRQRCIVSKVKMYLTHRASKPKFVFISLELIKF